MVTASRRVAALALVALFASTLASCSAAAAPTPSPAATAAPTAAASVAATPASTSSPTAAPTAASQTLTDDNSTAVTIPSNPARIVSLTPATTEILFALGAGDRIVARSEDPNPYPADAAKIPAVTSMGTVDIEKVVAAKPDLVIAGGLGFTPDDAIAQLRGLGIPVLVVYAPDIKTVYADMRLTGKAVGLADAADALATKTQADMTAVSQAATSAGGANPRVFYEIDASDAIYGPADKSFLAEMINQAGGTAITTGDPSLFSMPLEKLIKADPQVIVLGDAAYGTTAQAVAARPGWKVMSAVKSGDIRPVDDVVVTRPGPRLAQGLRDLALAINPKAVIPSPAP